MNLPLADVWLDLHRSPDSLTSDVNPGAPLVDAVGRFDLTPGAGKESFTPWLRPELPDDWTVGAIVGGSGTGKSTLLAEFGEPEDLAWDPSRAIGDQVDGDIAAAFYAVGLSSVPTWLKPYHVLSNGEKFRADLARRLHDGAVIDEFTSVVDRTVAAAASRSFGKYLRQNGIRQVVIATVHRDVLPWLEPDWIIDTDAGMYALDPKECLQRGEMVAEVHEVERAMWAHFMGHHYLTDGLHPFARCYIATVSGQVAAFAAAIPFPHGHIRNGWRGTRLVTLPDFQGLGVGPRLGDWVAEAHRRAGYAYYTKTTHPRLGRWRDESPAWEPVGSRSRPAAAPSSFASSRERPWVGSSRPSFSHRYVGAVAE